jgi:hypothetical protein
VLEASGCLYFLLHQPKMTACPMSELQFCNLESRIRGVMADPKNKYPTCRVVRYGACIVLSFAATVGNMTFRVGKILLKVAQPWQNAQL